MQALLLLAFGGPRSLNEVEPFLTRLFGSRRPAPDQLDRVKERYRLIGGSSPLPGITTEQAKRLEERLNARGRSFKSYVGMRYGHPLIDETLREIIRDGMRRVIAIPMTPFRSRASTGAYREEVRRVSEPLGGEMEISFIEGWHLHPLFLDAVRQRIREGLAQFAPEERQGVHLIFTAHSLPKSMIEGDPYLQEMEASVRGVLQGMEPLPYRIAFQSRGGGPGEWVGPDVESVLADLAAQRVAEVLVVPIGFVSDHIEILYDIDWVYRKKAESLGMVLKRSPSLNASERFLEALASVVEEHVKGVKGLSSR